MYSTLRKKILYISMLGQKYRNLQEISKEASKS